VLQLPAVYNIAWAPQAAASSATVAVSPGSLPQRSNARQQQRDGVSWHLQHRFQPCITWRARGKTARDSGCDRHRDGTAAHTCQAAARRRLQARCRSAGELNQGALRDVSAELRCRTVTGCIDSPDRNVQLTVHTAPLVTAPSVAVAQQSDAEAAALSPSVDLGLTQCSTTLFYSLYPRVSVYKTL
jgi:hypothetical protein